MTVVASTESRKAIGTWHVVRGQDGEDVDEWVFESLIVGDLGTGTVDIEGEGPPPLCGSGPSYNSASTGTPKQFGDFILAAFTAWVLIRAAKHKKRAMIGG